MKDKIIVIFKHMWNAIKDLGWWIWDLDITCTKPFVDSTASKPAFIEYFTAAGVAAILFSTIVLIITVIIAAIAHIGFLTAATIAGIIGGIRAVREIHK